MLHRIDTGKVLESILTEEVFRRTYCREFLSANAAYGWIQASRPDARNFEKDWYLCLADRTRIARSTKTLIDKLSVKGYRFFLVTNLSVAPITGEPSFCVYPIGHDGLALPEPDMVRTKLLLTKTFAGVSKCRQRPAAGVNWITGYLATYSDQQVLELYIGRCLMDFGLDYPGNIDAIDNPQGRIIFYEFKRKDCAKGYYRPDKAVETPKFRPYIRKMREAIEAIEQPTRADISAAMETILPSQRVNDVPCLGLDYYSHVQNVITAHYSNIPYRHVIWERTTTPINQLLTPGLDPIGSFNLIVADIGLNDFAGFNFTDPKDSGDVHKSHGKKAATRLQLMILRSRFKSVAVSAGNTSSESII